MNPVPQPIFCPGQVAKLLLSHPKRWLLPAAAVFVLTGIYAAVRPATWQASQALVIRNEAATNGSEPGKFSHADEMKTFQETILELVRSEGVLETALRKVGPPARRSGAKPSWPSADEVADLRDRLELSPPKGAEFGTTEIFYLHVRDRSRSRAIALANAITEQLERRFQELRDARAASMSGELARAADVARRDLVEATSALKAFERDLGSDLAELRAMEDSTGGESGLRRTTSEIHNEIRVVRSAKQTSEELLAVLLAARHDVGRLIATPNTLLESQPALRQLKAGLVDAQLKLADLRGRLSDNHPQTQNAVEAEREIRGQLHKELDTAIDGVGVEVRLSADRLTMLEEQLAATTARLQRLAGLRAEYANLIAQVDSRTAVLRQADQSLSEARFGQATARATSLIGRVDQPQTGPRPRGPGRRTILLGGLIGGLLVGLAVALLTLPISHAGDRAGGLDEAHVWTVALAGHDLRVYRDTHALVSPNGNGSCH
jgi:uncharacterized protein involved in exopolysaccharide biosynthesis